MHLLLTANDFPVLRRALMLSAHGDQLVRTQARAAYLTILRGLLDEEVREKAIQLAQEMLLFTVWFMYRNHVFSCEYVVKRLWAPTTQILDSFPYSPIVMPSFARLYVCIVWNLPTVGSYASERIRML